MHVRVDMANEGDGFEILASAMLVGDPLARLAAVIAVEHRGDGVDAQPVDMEVPQPEEGARGEEAHHLMAPVIVDQRVPIPVQALARVLMLVERRPVEARKPVRIGGKMPGHPVEDHADAVDSGRH